MNAAAISNTKKPNSNDEFAWHEVVVDTVEAKATRVYPKKGQTYTLDEISKLYLPEQPLFSYTHNAVRVNVQRPDVPLTEVVGNAHLAASKWEYKYLTEDFIPVFFYNDARPITEILTIEDSKTNYGIGSEKSFFWVNFVNHHRAEPTPA